MARLTKGLERALRYAKAARRTYFTALDMAKAAEIPARTARHYCQILTRAMILEKAYTFPQSYRYTSKRNLAKCWEPIMKIINEE